ncbi:MAG: hypothetical protein ACRCR1_01590 [Aeromonas sp.]
MLSLLLCASLWQFDAPRPLENPDKVFEVTRGDTSPSVRDDVARRLELDWQNRAPQVRITFTEPEPRYADTSPLTRMLNDREDGWESKLAVEW